MDMNECPHGHLGEGTPAGACLAMQCRYYCEDRIGAVVAKLEAERVELDDKLDYAVGANTRLQGDLATARAALQRQVDAVEDVISLLEKAGEDQETHPAVREFCALAARSYRTATKPEQGSGHGK